VGGSVAGVKGGETFPFLFFGVRPGDWLDDGVHAYELHFVKDLDEDRRAALAQRLAALGASSAWAWAGPWRWQGRFALVSLRATGSSREAARALHAAVATLLRGVHAVAPLVSATYLHAADAGTDPWDDFSLARAAGPVLGPRWASLDPGLLGDPARGPDTSVVDASFEAQRTTPTWRVERTVRAAPPPPAPVAPVTPAEPAAEATPTPAAAVVFAPTRDADADADADAETPPAPDALVSPPRPEDHPAPDWSAVAPLGTTLSAWPTFALSATHPKNSEIRRPRPGRELAVFRDKKTTRVLLWVDGALESVGGYDQDSDSTHPSLHPTRDAVLFVDESESRVMLWEPPTAPRALPIPMDDTSFVDCAWLDDHRFALLSQDGSGVMVFALHGDALTLEGRIALLASGLEALPGGFLVYDPDDAGDLTVIVLALDGDGMRVVGGLKSTSVNRVTTDGFRVWIETHRKKERPILELVDLEAAFVQARGSADADRHPWLPLLSAKLSATSADDDEDSDDSDGSDEDGSDEDGSDEDGSDDADSSDPSAVTDADEAFSTGQDHRYDENFDAAIRWLDRAIELQPTHRDAWAELGVARSQKGDPEGARIAWEEALRLVERVLASEADDREALLAAVTLYARLGQRETMLGRLRALIDLDRSYASYVRNDEAFVEYLGDAEFDALVAKPKKSKKTK